MSHEYASPNHPVWAEVAPELTPRDFRYPYHMSVEFLRELSRARRRGNVPFRVVSDYREPSRNEAAGGASQSAHLELPCASVDLRAVSNEERYHLVLNLIAGDALDALRAVLRCGAPLPPDVRSQVVRALDRPGFTRIGLYPPTAHQIATYGKGAGSVHVDASPKNPQPRIWMSV